MQTLTVALMLVVQVSIAAQQEPTLFEKRMKDAMHDALADFATQNKMGIWIAYRNATEAFEMAFGTSDGKHTPAANNDIIPCGSLTKPYTAIAILRLVEKGKFKLDDPVQPTIDPYIMKYNSTTLQELGWPADIANVTVRMLLHMDSGVRDYDNNIILGVSKCAYNYELTCAQT